MGEEGDKKGQAELGAAEPQEAAEESYASTSERCREGTRRA